MPKGNWGCVRQLLPEDGELLAQCVKIEEECFTDPWSEQQFLSAAERDTHCVVAALDHENHVMGYLVFVRFTGEAELQNIAVAPEHRRGGIASAMMGFLVGQCRRLDIFLEVRVSNRAARALYRKFGFYEIGVRRDYYEAPCENAIIMKRSPSQWNSNSPA